MYPSLSVMYFLGQYLFSKDFQVFISLSITTGYLIPFLSTAIFTLFRSFSNSNSGECTPIINKPSSAYFSFHAVMYGIVLMHLMQLEVQRADMSAIRMALNNRPSGVVLI